MQSFTTFKVSWEEFKKHCEKIKMEEEDELIVFRGQSSSQWELQSTLARFLPKESLYRASKYYLIVKNIYDRIILNKEIKLPEECPFYIALLEGNSTHSEEINNALSAIVELRHLGFPSPILDWTKNFMIATFFAFSTGKISDNAAIYCLKIKKLKDTERFEIFEPWFYYKDTNSIKYCTKRHMNQESVYTLSMYNDKNEYYRDKRDPFFCLDSEINHPRCCLEKYIIEDSEKRRIDILNELFNKNVTHERIYNETHQHENTLLKDMAIKELLFK